MKPYYEDATVTLYHGDCREVLPTLAGVVVTDPPFNVGYHYDTYTDRLGADDYAALLAVACRTPAVVIHYPEAMFTVAQAIGEVPTRAAAWVYNSNTPRQWRMVAWFGVAPDFRVVKQPYKNPTDSRVRSLIEAGSEGTSLYDWWEVDQVKNVSDEKTGHPCQMPLEVMRRIVGVTPGDVIIDPFAGSGTTLRAAKDLGRRAIGIEMDERYCEMTARRMGQEVLGLSA
jgi:site-specific DNA-methyltransferase (adenine-specific)